MICTTLHPLIYGGMRPAGVEVDIADEAQARRLIAKGIVAEGGAAETAPEADRPADYLLEDMQGNGPLGDMTITDAPDDAASTTDAPIDEAPPVVAPRRRGRPRKS